MKGFPIRVPVYEHKSLKRISSGTLEKYDHIIFEGLYANYDKGIHMLSNLKIHLECSDSILLQRWMERDLERRVMDTEQSKIYFENIALPTFKKYGSIQKENADHIFDSSNCSFIHNNLGAICNDINQYLRD